MEKELQDNLKLVDKWYNRNDTRVYFDAWFESPNYHDDWTTQIPVWAKLCKHIQHKNHITRTEQAEYEIAVRNDNPRAGFDLLVSIIKRIKQ